MNILISPTDELVTSLNSWELESRKGLIRFYREFVKFLFKRKYSFIDKHIRGYKNFPKMESLKEDSKLVEYVNENWRNSVYNYFTVGLFNETPDPDKRRKFLKYRKELDYILKIKPSIINAIKLGGALIVTSDDATIFAAKLGDFILKNGN